MALNFPWLKTRTLLLKGVIIDLLIITAFNFQHFNFKPTFSNNLFSATTSMIWVTFGYIFGKYYNKKELFNNRYLLKQSLIAIILPVLVFLINQFIENSNLVGIYISSKSNFFFLVKVSFLSFVSQTILKKFINFKIQKPSKWFFI